MSKPLPLFEDGAIEEIAQILGSAYKGGTLTRIFEQISLHDPLGSNATKWRRVDQALRDRQKQDRAGNIVVIFLEAACTPARFLNCERPQQAVLDDLNVPLALAALKIHLDGRVRIAERATTLSEAVRRAESVVSELRRRHVHPQVLRCCEQELLAKNLFHGEQEATKSLFARLRSATGSPLDGGALVEHCFGAGQTHPRIAINKFETQTEKSMHHGLANALKAAYSLWRNPTAHELRLTLSMVERDVIDALTFLSFLHRQLDDAVVTGTGGKV
jgi:uncharacterized protein (TIGR02391 family)